MTLLVATRSKQSPLEEDPERLRAALQFGSVVGLKRALFSDAEKKPLRVGAMHIAGVANAEVVLCPPLARALGALGPRRWKPDGGRHRGDAAGCDVLEKVTRGGGPPRDSQAAPQCWQRWGPHVRALQQRGKKTPVVRRPPLLGAWVRWCFVSVSMTSGGTAALLLGQTCSRNWVTRPGRRKQGTSQVWQTHKWYFIPLWLRA